MDIGFILKETQGLWCPLAAQSPKPILDSISLQDVEIRLVFNCLQIPPKLPSLLVMLSLDKISTQGSSEKVIKGLLIPQTSFNLSVPQIASFVSVGGLDGTSYSLSECVLGHFS